MEVVNSQNRIRKINTVDDIRVGDMFTWVRNPNKPNAVLSAPGEDFIKERPMCVVTHTERNIIKNHTCLNVYCKVVNMEKLSTLMQLYFYQHLGQDKPNLPYYNLYKIEITNVSIAWHEFF